jgi:hypothetical protein
MIGDANDATDRSRESSIADEVMKRSPAGEAPQDRQVYYKVVQSKPLTRDRIGAKKEHGRLKNLEVKTNASAWLQTKRREEKRE